VAYYITGHGLGHATRSLLVVEYLLSRGASVHIVSAIPPSFFESHLAAAADTRLQCHQRTLDSGAIQQHSLAVDPLATLRKYRDHVHVNRDALIVDEAAFLRSQNVDVVFVDATPVACAAAQHAGCCRCVLVTNFTWDVIYRDMLAYPHVHAALLEGEREQLEAMVAQCSADCGTADAYLQLPGRCPWPPGFPADKVVGTAPLVARRAQRPRQVVREGYGVPDPATQVLLVGFGGHDTQWQLTDASLPVGWVAWVLGAKDADLPPDSKKFRPIEFNCHVPDLIAAAEVVVGKLGYGTVSECLTHGTPLVYVPRLWWPEEEPLRELLDSYGGGLCMPTDAFVAGEWSPFLAAAMDRKDAATYRPEERVVETLLADPTLHALLGDKFAALAAP